MTYSHRNGETEQPTVPGVFWFWGTVDDLERRGIIDVAELIDNPGTVSGLAWPHWFSGWIHLSELPGRWWGPLEMPWEECDE